MPERNGFPGHRLRRCRAAGNDLSLEHCRTLACKMTSLYGKASVISVSGDQRSGTVWRTGRRLVWAALLTAAIAGVGCSAPHAPDATAPDTDTARRELHREQLRTSLGERYDVPLEVATLEQIRHGAKLYDKLCRACHGRSGRGDGRSAAMLLVVPPDLADPRTASFFSDQAKLAIIAEGVAGTPMLRWGGVLDERDQIAVLQFMRTLIREPKAP